MHFAPSPWPRAGESQFLRLRAKAGRAGRASKGDVEAADVIDGAAGGDDKSVKHCAFHSPRPTRRRFAVFPLPSPTRRANGYRCRTCDASATCERKGGREEEEILFQAVQRCFGRRTSTWTHSTTLLISDEHHQILDPVIGERP